MQSLAYKPDLPLVIDRLRLLYDRQAEDRIFARIEVPSRALAAFGQQYAEGFCDYPDPPERATFWDALLAERAQVEDDSVPSAYPSEFDQGLYGGLVGGQAQFMAHPENGWISSMVAPMLADWSELDELAVDETGAWMQRYLDQLECFRDTADGRFGISHFILIDGLNFCFELVGATDTYMALEDQPERVRQAIEFAFDLNCRVQDLFFDRVPKVCGGTCSNMVQWVPGRVISESVDPFHMTSVDYFERWGREPVQRIFDRYDGGVLHIHGNGRHLLEAVCSLRGLKAIFMGDDKGYPRAIDVVAELKGRAGATPLVVQVGFDEFSTKLKRSELPGGVFYHVGEAPDADAANRCMERVRAYRAV